MKRFKKILVLALACVMLFGTTLTVSPQKAFAAALNCPKCSSTMDKDTTGEQCYYCSKHDAVFKHTCRKSSCGHIVYKCDKCGKTF